MSDVTLWRMFESMWLQTRSRYRFGTRYRGLRGLAICCSFGWYLADYLAGSFGLWLSNFAAT